MAPPVPLHFGEPRDALFGWYHPPDPAPSGDTRRCGVVLCNPIGDDDIRAHRTLRHLAERLASAGFPALRFDFHGTGDSSGDERDPDRVRVWLDDIDRAVAELRARSGAAEVGLVGLRMGATIAALAAARAGGVSSVVLWGACETGASFVEETTRLHKMHRMLEPESFAAGPKRHAEGEEALGFFLSNETIVALKALDLRALTTPPARHALVIGVANAEAEDSFVPPLRSAGVDVDFRRMPGHKFLIAIPHKSAVPSEVIDAIVGWFERRYPAGAEAPSRGTPTSREDRPSPAGRVTRGAVPTHLDDTARPAAQLLEESRILVGGAHRLFGILTAPPEGERRADRPCVILLNAGCVHRIGAHRLSVRMARTWAERGLYVLRMDLSGIGDSPVASGCEENLCYPKSGIDDCQRAMSFMEREIGATRFILAGLCSGADIAFQLGFKDGRAAGVVMMNPRTFCVHDLSMVETQQGARYYQGSLFRKDSWVKLMRGRVDLRRVARAIAPTVKNEAVRQVDRLMRRVRPAEPGPGAIDEARTDVPACLRTMAERGVDTFLVATVKDPGVDYVDIHYAKGMRGLLGLPNFRRVDVEGTDHTFTSVYSQEQVTHMITDHLVRRHVSSDGG
jgi:dienelactone hydrolase